MPKPIHTTRKVVRYSRIFGTASTLAADRQLCFMIVSASDRQTKGMAVTSVAKTHHDFFSVI
jgi:hypothetical protein